MSFNNYNDFKDAVSSEKLSLVFIYPRQGVTTFVDQGGNIWKRSVDHVVSSLFAGSIELTIQTSSAVDASNPWFYDIATNELWYYTTSTLPDDDNLIAEYILHYSNAPINMSFDLGDTSAEVEYEPRVLTTVGFKSEIGSDQKGISVTGSGTVSLQNNDGHFDSLFDAFIWENKRVEIYSYNRDLEPSLAQIQYKGFIVNKSFNTDKVSFKIQDSIFKLDTKVSMNLFTASDGVGPSFVGDVKRHVYGKVDGLLCRSIDQVGEGYTLTGTVSGSAASQTVTGSGSLFLTELAMNDIIIIDTAEYTVETITSDTVLSISETAGLEATYVTETMTSLPSIPNPEFNRDFFVADHAISQSNTTITSMTQLNRLTVADISGFEVGDTIKISGDPFTVFNISGDQIQISVNAAEFYANGTAVTKEPITRIFNEGVGIDINDLSSITNTTECTFTLSNTAEFTIAKNKLIDDANFTFTNGSRIVSYAGAGDISNFLQERDWIKAPSDADSTFMRIVDIVGTDIRCATTYTGTDVGGSKKATKRRPNYITDSSSVSVNVLGKTVDGTSTGALIRTGADMVKELLIDIDLEDDLDVTSFTNASLDNSMRLSAALPYSISDSAPAVKNIINDINQTVFGSLSLKQDLTLAYFINSAERTDDIETIADDDVIKWKMVGKETKSYKRVLGSYRFIDFDNTKFEEGHSLVDFSSDRITNYDISNKEVDREFRVYETNDAQELSERFIHYNEQTLMELNITSDLRLAEIEIGDKVGVNFARFINQPSIGDSQRVFSVIGLKKDHNKIELKLSDLGNLYNRSAVISDNGTADYSASTSEEKRFNSYITDNNGLITTFDDSKGTNLIS